jgi:AcrR family transcriptional regulator
MSRKPARERKDEIIEITRNLIFNQGLSNFTMRTVAKLTGVSEAAIYKHFAGKEDLLMALLHSLFDPWQEALKKLKNSRMKVDKRLVKLAETHIKFLFEKQLNPVLFFSEAMNPENSKLITVLQENLGFLKTTVSELIEEGITEKQFAENIDIEAAAACFIGIIQGAVIRWTVMQNCDSLKNETIRNVDFFLERISNRGDR